MAYGCCWIAQVLCCHCYFLEWCALKGVDRDVHRVTELSIVQHKISTKRVLIALLWKQCYLFPCPCFLTFYESYLAGTVIKLRFFFTLAFPCQ